MVQNKKFYKLISIVMGLCLVFSLCIFTEVKNRNVFASSVSERSACFDINNNDEFLNENVFEMNMDSTSVTGNHLMDTVYFDPAQTTGGSDSNSGETRSAAVSSLAKVQELLAPNGTIYFLSTMTITSDMTIDFELGGAKLKRYCKSDADRFTGEMFVLGSETIHVNVLIKNAIIDGLGYGTESLLSPNYLINAKNASLTMGTGSGIVNCVRENSGSGIYISEMSDLFINDAVFKNNKMKDSIIVKASSTGVADGEIRIENGTFENNTSENNSSIILSYGGNIVINGGLFTNNKTGALIFCPSGNNNITINNGTFINNVNSLNFDATSKTYAELSIGSILGFSQGKGRSANVKINGGDFFKNGSERFGGGCFGIIEGSFSILGGSFKNNFAPVGGVFFCNLLQDADLSSADTKRSVDILVKDASFFGNTAGYRIREDKPVGTVPYADINANLILLDVKFLDFESSYKFDFASKLSGGGVFCSTQTVTIQNSRFDSNYASGDVLETTNNNMQGGGVFLFRGYDLNEKLLIENSLFTDNKTAYIGGVGNIASGESTSLGKSSNMAIYSSNFTNNQGKNAGALFGEGNIYIKDSYFVKNNATENGGALETNGLIENCYFERNYAGVLGGAIKSPTIEIIDSTLEYNFAPDAGCIYADKLTLKNNMITNNLATSLPGTNGVIKCLEGNIALDNFIFDNKVGNRLDISAENPTPEGADKQENILFQAGFPQLDENNKFKGGIDSDLFITPELTNKVLFSSVNVKNNGKIFIFIPNIYLRDSKNPICLISKVSDLQGILSVLKLNENGFKLSTQESTSVIAGQTETVFALYVNLMVAGKGEIRYIANDYVGYYDGKEHGIELMVFGENGPLTYKDAKVKFGTSPGTCSLDDMPKFTITNLEGQTVYFQIGQDEVQSRKVIIKRMELSKIDGYHLTVKYGQKLTKGMDVTEFFKDDLLDKKGNRLNGGTFKISESLNETIVCVPGKNAKIAIVYEPNNKSMDSIPIYLDENNSFIYETYDKLYFYDSFFHIADNEQGNTYAIPKGQVQFAINQMNNNGVIEFKDSFLCDNCYTITIPENKNIEFKRSLTYILKFFEIPQLQTLVIDASQGSLVFNGILSGVQNGAMIENHGNLTLLGRIKFIDGKNNYTENLASNAGAIHNAGTAVIDGIKGYQLEILRCVSKSYGGAIYNEGKLTIKNARINKSIAQRGGAIYSDAVDSELIIDNCLFDENGAYRRSYSDGTQASGFTIFVDKGKAVINNLKIIDSRLFVGENPIDANFQSYQNENYRGSGIFVGRDADVTIKGALFDNCIAYVGAAIYVEGIATLSDIVVSRCMVCLSGAALYSTPDSVVKFVDIISSKNSFLAGGTPQVDEQLDILVNEINKHNPVNQINYSNIVLGLISVCILLSVLAVIGSLLEVSVDKKKKRNLTK